MKLAEKAQSNSSLDEVNEFRSQLEILNQRNVELQEKVVILEEQNAWFHRQIFGSRSERVVDVTSSQNPCLPGLEPIDDEVTSSTEEPPAKPRRRKRKSKNDNSNGLNIPENLPVEREFVDLPEKEKVCPLTGEKMIQIGEEVTRRIAHRQGEFFVKEIVRPKYALLSREEDGISIAELPETILPKCRADDSLLAEIVTRKFADHLPLYRISEILSRNSIEISRQLLSQWIIRLGTELMPLQKEMLKHIKESGVIYVDETPVKLQVKGKGKLKQAYMWVVVGGEGSDPPYRVYQFFENRNHSNAFELLEGFEGIMHSDKYGAYVKLAEKEEIFWQACWVHIRRKFEEAQSGDPEFRAMILRKIRYLYMLERVAWSRSPEERLIIRREKEDPIIDEIVQIVKEKVEENSVLPKSKLGKALNYFYSLVPFLKTYHLHPSSHMDNSTAERAIRALAIGRKNWLFVGSMEGGAASAVLYSLVQTCRGLGINPREYLEDIMRRLQGHPANRLSELLPDQWAAARDQPPIVTKPLHIR